MERSRKMNNSLCQQVLDLLDDEHKCINIINTVFNTLPSCQLSTPISVADLLKYTEYSRTALSMHLKTNEEFYKLLGLTRGVSNQYLINGKVALLVIANFNSAFAAYIGYTTHADVEIQYRNQLQLEKVMEGGINMSNLSEELIELETKLSQDLCDAQRFANNLCDDIDNLELQIKELKSKQHSTIVQIEQLRKKLGAIKVLLNN